MSTKGMKTTMPTPTPKPRPHYYPFGSSLNTRSFSAGSGFRFGFNGQESNNEVYGTVNFYSFKYRMSNPRLGGQFWSIDPLLSKYPSWSSYHFAQRTPIWARELEGLEAWYTTDKSGNQELMPNVAGPLSNSYAKQIGATNYGVFKNQNNYSFSDQEIQNFSDWNETKGPIEPGHCLGCAVTGSEKLTGINAGFRNSKGRNVLSGKTLYDLGKNLEERDAAIEIPVKQGQETSTILNNPNSQGTENTAYIAGPAGAYHSIIITHNTRTNEFSIFDQGTGWDIKNTNQQGAQQPIDYLNNLHPNWGSRMWQLHKPNQVKVLIPIEQNNE